MSRNTYGYSSISPLSGRYAQLVQPLSSLFSEAALIQFRTQVEIEYLIALLEKTHLANISQTDCSKLRNIYKKFSDKSVDKIKKYEQTCHHDVKAVEYYLQDKLKEHKLQQLVPFIHFGLTSEDTNSLAYGLMLERSRTAVILPEIKALILSLLLLAEKNSATVMMGRTHGQPAVPTTLGKELIIFAVRLEKIWQDLHHLKLEGKCNGAVGNWQVHQLFFPKINWPNFSKQFISSFGLSANNVTNQILPAESYSHYFQNLILLNQIVIDCCRDCWQYVSDGYLKQRVKSGEVGSSTMPQKVNPIDFENAEGNAGLSTALLQHLVEKLPVSRLQRDLSDSTVKRSIGVALGHSLLAMKSLRRGLAKVSADEVQMKADLTNHPEMLAEAVQSAWRLDGKPDAYEVIKKLSRGRKFDHGVVKSVVQQISDDKLRAKIENLETEEYLGMSEQITKKEIGRIKKSLAKPPTRGK